MRARNLFLLLMIAALAGCQTSYRYGGARYRSPAGAIAAQQRDLDNVLASIQRRSTPIASHARVVIPNKEAILERGVKPLGSGEVRNYYASIFYNGVQFMPRAIKKRNLFERVDVEETATPDFLRPTPGIITIYRYVSSDRNDGWYYTSETTPRAPVNFDFGQSDLAGRYKSILDSIEAVAEREKKN